jgi:hypothetical protein
MVASANTSSKTFAFILFTGYPRRVDWETTDPVLRGLGLGENESAQS